VANPKKGQRATGGGPARRGKLVRRAGGVGAGRGETPRKGGQGGGAKSKKRVPRLGKKNQRAAMLAKSNVAGHGGAWGAAPLKNPGEQKTRDCGGPRAEAPGTGQPGGGKPGKAAGPGGRPDATTGTRCAWWRGYGAKPATPHPRGPRPGPRKGGKDGQTGGPGARRRHRPSEKNPKRATGGTPTRKQITAGGDNRGPKANGAHKHPPPTQNGRAPNGQNRRGPAWGKGKTGHEGNHKAHKLPRRTQPWHRYTGPSRHLEPRPGRRRPGDGAPPPTPTGRGYKTRANRGPRKGGDGGGAG